MVKLVALGPELAGQSFELKVDKTTVGRVPDNTITIPHASVSSHHCEIVLRGEEVLVKDLESRNGTFINNRQVTGENVLKVGEILRLGQVEMRLEAGTVKVQSQTSMEQSTSSVFEARPASKGKKLFIIVGILLLIVVAAAIYFAFNSLSNHHGQ